MARTDASRAAQVGLPGLPQAAGARRDSPVPTRTGSPAAAAVPHTDPGQVPAARPAPPPSAPAPSRTEPTRAGCSAGSPGWCTAAAGTARGLPRDPRPRRPEDRRCPPRHCPPAKGSCSPLAPAAAAAAVEGPPSPGRLHRRPRARPLCVGPRPGRGARGRQLGKGPGRGTPRGRPGGGRLGAGRGGDGC